MMGDPCDKANTCVGARVHTCVLYTQTSVRRSRVCRNIKEESTASEKTGQARTVHRAAGSIGRGHLSRVRRAQPQPPPHRRPWGRPRGEGHPRGRPCGAGPHPGVAPLLVRRVLAGPCRAAAGFPDSVEAPEQRRLPAAWPLEGQTQVALSPSAAVEKRALRGLSSRPQDVLSMAGPSPMRLT